MNMNFQRRAFLARLTRFASVGALAALAGTPAVHALMPARWTITRRKEVMLDQLSLADFSPHLGQKFALKLAAGQTREGELIEATSLGCKGARPAHLAAREPFSVTFLAPNDVRITQRIYHLKHESFGEFDIFLVPIGLDERGLRCEAIFN
jgi:hypothetical protein